MNNNNENVFTVDNSRDSVKYFVSKCDLRAVQELTYQLGIVSPRDEESLRNQTAQALNDEAMNKLCQRYNLKMGSSIEDIVRYLKQDIVSQLNSSTWATIDSAESRPNWSIMHLPLPFSNQTNMVSFSIPSNSVETEDFSSAYLSFFRWLPKRGRQAFAEAFGVDVDILSACFTDEGLAFLQNKYGYPNETTFSDFSRIFQHALGIQIPTENSEDWKWISEFEKYRGCFTHAKGLFPGYGSQMHTYEEARPATSVLPFVNDAENALGSAMKDSRIPEDSHGELI